MTEPNYAAPAASRLLDIIELLVDEPEGLTLSEISRRQEISTNSVFRICRVLEERGYLARDERSGLLCLTSQLYTLGSRLGNRIDLVALARPHLHWLTEQTGENAHISVLSGDRLVLLEQSMSLNPVRVIVETGFVHYPHASAFGKAILANLPADQQAALLAMEWPKLTPYTRTDPQQMAEEWQDVARSGLAYDLEEYIVGVRCLGAPVFGKDGRVVAGMGVMGPSSRLTPDELNRFEPLVRDAAARLSQEMGAPIELPILTD